MGEAEDRSFIYEFRSSHSVKVIVVFSVGLAYSAWQIARARTTAGQVIAGVVGLFFLRMIWIGIGTLQRRKIGGRKIVLGATTLTVPRTMVDTKVIEIPYTEITSVGTTGKDGALQIVHAGGTLEIARVMLATNEEHADVVRAVRERVSAAAA